MELYRDLHAAHKVLVMAGYVRAAPLIPDDHREYVAAEQRRCEVIVQQDGVALVIHKR